MSKITIVPAFIIAKTEDNAEANERASALACSINERLHSEPDHDGTVLLLDEDRCNHTVEMKDDSELPHTYPDKTALYEEVAAAAQMAVEEFIEHGEVFRDAIARMRKAIDALR